jgi:hypothetical protein
MVSLFRNTIFSSIFALTLSCELIIEASEPDTTAKNVTPISIKIVQKIYSAWLLAEKSPYPTVVIVVTMK